jgi:hypothetical protein
VATDPGSRELLAAAPTAAHGWSWRSSATIALRLLQDDLRLLANPTELTRVCWRDRVGGWCFFHRDRMRDNGFDSPTDENRVTGGGEFETYPVWRCTRDDNPFGDLNSFMRHLFYGFKAHTPAAFGCKKSSKASTVAQHPPDGGRTHRHNVGVRAS